MKRLLTILFLISLCIPSLSLGQEDEGTLTLERIFNSREFSSERFGPARWLEDGSGYTTLEPSETAGGGMDIVRYNPETGEGQVMVSASLLIPQGSDEPLRIADYSWSADGGKLLIFTNTRRVWRRNTRGDYWVLDRSSGQLRQLGADFEESRLMFAKFSPDAGRVAYVMKNNIFVEDLESGTITQLTSDGSDTIINGTFDWVYEEELSLRDGFRWSPDGSTIAYWQLDASGVGIFFMINNTDTLYPALIPVQYPKVGTTNSAGKVGVVSAAGGETTWMKIPGEPRQHYIARMHWTPDSKELYVQQLNRLQNTNKLMACAPATGEVKLIFTDTNDAWLNPVDDFKWLEGGKSFTWLSERDGWRHAYIISRDGGKIVNITPGEYDISRILEIDDAGGWLYFLASPDNPTRMFLHRVRLDGSGTLERLTPEEMTGMHSYQVAPGGAYAIHNWSSFGEPSQTDLVTLPEHASLRSLVENKELRAKVNELNKGESGFFRLDIGDGLELDGYYMKPHDFDPSKKYPLLFHVYGEPAGQTVLDHWGGSNYLWHLMLTQRGYVIVSIDNRGTPAPRGDAWRKSVYRKIGIIASQDQAAAARQIIDTWDFIDPERIGIWGWSGGGSMTLNMLFRYPDIYKTGMSVAPVTDQRLYDTIYQERYMSLPDDNEEGFREGSPITFAHQLEGNLLLVHGTADDNVHYQSSERLINELIRHGKRFTMMAYPNRSHGIYEGEGTRLHLYDLLTWYLQSNLPAGARQAD